MASAVGAGRGPGVPTPPAQVVAIAPDAVSPRISNGSSRTRPQAVIVMLSGNRSRSTIRSGTSASLPPLHSSESQGRPTAQSAIGSSSSPVVATRGIGTRCRRHRESCCERISKQEQLQDAINPPGRRCACRCAGHRRLWRRCCNALWRAICRRPMRTSRHARRGECLGRFDWRRSTGSRPARVASSARRSGCSGSARRERRHPSLNALPCRRSLDFGRCRWRRTGPDTQGSPSRATMRAHRDRSTDRTRRQRALLAAILST